MSEVSYPSVDVHLDPSVDSFRPARSALSAEHTKERQVSEDELDYFDAWDMDDFVEDDEDSVAEVDEPVEEEIEEEVIHSYYTILDDAQTLCDQEVARLKISMQAELKICDDNLATFGENLTPAEKREKNN